MAEPKNKVREETFMERLMREEREFDEKHPILDTRYYVEEYQKYPHLYIGDDGAHPAPTLKAKYGPFTKTEFDAWMEKFEPSKDCFFVPRHENLRHYSYDKWGR